MSGSLHVPVPVLPALPKSQLKVLRAVASLELAKGLIVLGAGLSVLLLVHRDAGDIADWCLQALHISPDHHFAQIFLNWADTLTEKKLFTVAGAASIYSTLRFVEAYGLWKARVWGEWIALVSGGLYLPFEIYKLMGRVNILHCAILLINLAVVFYMAYFLQMEREAKARAKAAGFEH